MTARHSALRQLDVLVGAWTISVPGLGDARCDVDWQHEGRVLREYSDADPLPDTAPQEWRDNYPFPTTCLIGLDDATGEFTKLYFDGRGVHRVYRMSLADGRWRQWREAEGFHQRFSGEFTADGDRIDARWERGGDGVDWQLDFELTYTRRG